MASADINRLNVAYAKALRKLHLVDRNDPVTKMVAKKVIEVGTFVTDPRVIAELVVGHFRNTES
jgi:hypothetical protein